MIAGTLPPSSAILNSEYQKNATATSDDKKHEKSKNDSNERSAALERAYVHDVYENCDETPGSTIRPRVAQFLAKLDAGSLICDVGCGNGRYLNTSANPFIYTIGVDRCYKLSKVTRSRGSEVAICDNLELPFRDNSFDAVLSLAVVHHFATTERRVGAIKELARILRIGGRVIITVWALEQKHRRFESQDVLIPWQKPSSVKNSNGSDEDEDDYLPPYHAYKEDSSNSSRSTSAGDGDTSSLTSSSPGESCYSFVRRAIKKLASGKKHQWLLDAWSSKDARHTNSLDFEDAQNLPIELRHLEDIDDLIDPPLSAGLKSRSLGSILNLPPPQIVRSRSSVPSLGAQIDEKQTPPVVSSVQKPYKPKLVKQKQSLCDDDDEFTILNDSPFPNETKKLIRKQSSLNEELMMESRLREKEKIRKRIQKQYSLNEQFLCRSVFSKRLQVIKDGFTTKLKTSTGSLERITKNGFVKIMQNFKTSQSQENLATTETNKSNNNSSMPNKTTSTATAANNTTNTIDEKMRKHSMESGSDSSKDSSLQSDTSIESEDSFASVIYIPKPEQITNSNTNDITNNIIKIPSVPSSPLIMPCPTPAHSPAPHRCKLESTADEPIKFLFEDEKIQTADITMCKQTLKAPVVKENSGKITRSDVNRMPIVPKYKRPNNHADSHKLIIPAVPKYTTLELFNPETDDIDSDSSEPSSPDSIDSVINALKPDIEKIPLLDDNGTSNHLINEDHETSTTYELCLPPPPKCCDKDKAGQSAGTEEEQQKQQLVDFAEQLSAQLLKELNKDSNMIIEKNTDDSNRMAEDNAAPLTINIDDNFIRRLNSEQNLTTLRERRLMLANLNSRSFTNSNNSFSSTIHEEDENSPTKTSDSELENDNNFDSVTNFKRNEDSEIEKRYNNISNSKNNNNNNLLTRFSDESPDHLVINSDDNLDLGSVCDNKIAGISGYSNSIERNVSEINCNNFDKNERKCNFNRTNDDTNDLNPNYSKSKTKKCNGNNSKTTAATTAMDKNTDTWTHSNSTVSLDSPSVGGASTHHRYYHVFREGELDSLINHHVTSLHIVSSYYERASWCVVAEKVQVWTI